MNFKRISLLTIIALLVVFGLPFSYEFNTPYISKLNNVWDIIAKVAATGSLIGLLYQFKRERDLNEADFIININQSFITNHKIVEVYQLLESSKEEGQKTDLFSDKNISEVANYISFFDPLDSLLERKIVNINTIDILAYRFFLATNNKYIQESLLARQGKENAWISIYKLHKKWRDHRIENGLEYWQEEFDLSKVKVYDKLVSL